MKDKKVTALEWLVGELNLGLSEKGLKLSFQTALEMEKQQIIDAYWDGGQDIPLTENRCEQYYNETYGGQNND
jgi:hypothetical protein